MIHWRWAIFFCLLWTATDVRAQGTAKAGASGTASSKRDTRAPQAKAAEDGKTTPETAKPATKARLKRGAKAEPEPSAAETAARALARKTKSVFMFAVESCGTTQSRCDAALADDAEKRFMDACGACTKFERCEAERKLIREGTARARTDPCAP